ncbi:MAG: efflux RND transporter permease subunit [bacterium]|nr:MAG: efflux RND transporter permease subunit [bacterium]
MSDGSHQSSVQDSRQTARGAIGWMAHNPVAANLIMVACLLGGFLMLGKITQEVFPSTEADIVRISLSYPGASPEEVEQGLILVVEEAIRGLDGVHEVSSTAGEGSGSVEVELLEGQDLQKLANDIESEVTRISTFPLDADDPEVNIVSRRRNVIDLVLYGQTSEAALHELGELARDQLLSDPGITQVELDGVRPLEISVEIPQENLRRYNLTLDEVAARLRSAAVDLPGGGIKTATGEILLRMKERRDYGRQFANIPVITAPDGTRVLLQDIAAIDDSYEEADSYAKFNGKPAVFLDVYRIGDQTPIQVADAVFRQLEILRTTLPEGIGISVLRDRAEVYRQRAELLIRNGILGIVLVLVILGIFLELRLAFWVMMGIPISFLGSLLFFPVLGISINMITLFAFIMAVGIVVDDAVIVGENVYYYYQEGDSLLDAAVKGAREIATPVTFSILTNVAAFMPLYFIPGVMGKVFKMIPLVVCTAFMISLFESLFILPAHLGHRRERKLGPVREWIHRHQQAFSRWFTNWVRDRFGPFLDGALSRRYLVLAIAVAVLAFFLAYAGSGRMGLGLFPRVESDFARASASLPYGSPVEKTEAVAAIMHEAAMRVVEESGHPELVTGIYTRVGRGGSHNLYMTVYLAEPEIRDSIMTTRDFTRKWREAVGDVPETDSLNFASDFGGPGSGAAITVELSHRDTAILEQASTELAEELLHYSVVKDIDDGYSPGKEQLDFSLTPEGKALGLTAQEVARQIRSAFYGSRVLRQQRGRNELTVTVRLPRDERTSEYNLQEMMVKTPTGVFVPLREVVEIHRGRAFTTIVRRAGRRVVQVTADINDRSRAGEVESALRDEEMPKLMASFPGLQYSFEGRAADTRESMSSLKIGFTMAILMIFTMLAIPFRSYIQPLIVMTSIPFGIIGAVIGHMIMGYSLSVVSMFGIVALSGVVVNDSLILIDFANHRIRDRGMSVHDAVLDAAIQRFRPILLTTATTFGGLAPMMFERALQARFMIPMAISLGYGILFATVITLVLVPSLYMVVEDAQRGFATLGRSWRKLTGSYIGD